MSSVDFDGLYDKVCCWVKDREPALMVSPILHRATGTTVTQLIRAFCREQCPLSGQGGLQGRGQRGAHPQGAPTPERGDQRGRSLEAAR